MFQRISLEPEHRQRIRFAAGEGLIAAGENSSAFRDCVGWQKGLESRGASNGKLIFPVGYMMSAGVAGGLGSRVRRVHEISCSLAVLKNRNPAGEQCI